MTKAQKTVIQAQFDAEKKVIRELAEEEVKEKAQLESWQAVKD